MPMPDWSEVEWYVYESPDGSRRVSPRKLTGDGQAKLRKKRADREKDHKKLGEMRAGEKFVAVVVGVSRRTVTSLLKAGVTPAELTRRVARAAEEQHKREAAADREPNRYRELRAKWDEGEEAGVAGGTGEPRRAA
jgi:hypothetical protein